MGSIKLCAVLVMVSSLAGGAHAQSLDSDGDSVFDQYESGDTDMDGIEDRLDADDDADGLLTALERPDPNDDGNPADGLDTDGQDGPNYLDADDDGDGIATFRERALNPASDLDQDTIVDYLDADADGSRYPAPALDADADGDGLTNAREDRDGDRVYADDDADADQIPDYLDEDDDGDGLQTRFERGDPLHPIDTDADGLANYLDADDDGDGLATSSERADLDSDGDPADAYSTAMALPDYLNDDDDDDGVPTATERPGGLSRDSDSDGVADDLDEDDDQDGLFHEGQSDTDGDGLANHLDADDDGDHLLSKDEVRAVRDTDHDGNPDPYDADDDGDGRATVEELDADFRSLDTDGDGVADHLDEDDDGDGVATATERSLAPLDFDADGTPDYLDTEDDGDGIPTRSELGPVSDVDGDGAPNWRDLDADSDGISDRDEGTGDNDGDGIPDFLDPPRSGTAADAGVDGSVAVDAGTDSGAGGGTGEVDPDTKSDSGCSVGVPRAASGMWLGSLLLALLALRRRRRAAGMGALMLVAGCDDEVDDGVSLDAGSTYMDSGRLDAATDARAVDSGGNLLASDCVLDDEGLTETIVESGARGWSAMHRESAVHLAYVVASCTGVGAAPSGTQIVYRSFGSTGGFGAASTLTSDPEGACHVRRAPALAWAGSAVDVYFTSNNEGSFELYRKRAASDELPTRLTRDGAEARDVELATVAAPFGDAPLLAYVNQGVLGEAAQLVTSRPGLAENQLLAVADGQEPSRLSLGSWSGDTVSGVLGWVSERVGAMTMRVQPLTPAGARHGESVELSDAVGALSSVAIAAAGDRAAVVYTVQSRPGGPGELRFRRLELDGRLSGREVLLTSSNRSVSSPAIAPYASGYVITYREVPERTEVSASIRLLFVADDGQVAGERRLADAARSGGTASQIYAMGDGRLVVLWSDYGTSGAQLRALRARCL